MNFTAIEASDLDKMHWRAAYETIVRRCAEEAMDRYCENPYDDLFVFYKESTDSEWGKLFVETAELNPEGTVLAIAKRVPKNLTVDQLFFWIRERTGWCPILKPFV